nr:MAG TPA: hypothetical protein [Caudoviricetes sp.]
MVSELPLSAVFLTVQLLLYLPVLFGAFACISFFTVLDTSFTASLTVSVARSAYSFRPSIIASASPSIFVLLSAILSPLCQGSPYFDCLILILHVIYKGNIINIPTEQNTEMFRIKTGHLTAVTYDKIKFRFRIELFCFPVLPAGKIIHIGITFIMVTPYKCMVSCFIRFCVAFLYRDPFAHESYHQNLSFLIPKSRYFSVSVMALWSASSLCSYRYATAYSSAVRTDASKRFSPARVRLVTSKIRRSDVSIRRRISSSSSDESTLRYPLASSSVTNILPPLLSGGLDIKCLDCLRKNQLAVHTL